MTTPNESTLSSEVTIETRTVLAGAYIRKGRCAPHLLTHAVNVETGLPLCRRVKAESICDAGADPEGLQAPPSCAECYRRDPRRGAK